MLLKPTRVPTHTITMHEGMMIAEASSLMLGHIDFTQVWDDACDVGLTLVSHRTGREVVYALEDIARDGEGDLLFWTLVPANLNERHLPELRIYND